MIQFTSLYTMAIFWDLETMDRMPKNYHNLACVQYFSHVTIYSHRTGYPSILKSRVVPFVGSPFVRVGHSLYIFQNYSWCDDWCNNIMTKQKQVSDNRNDYSNYYYEAVWRYNQTIHWLRALLYFVDKITNYNVNFIIITVLTHV